MTNENGAVEPEVEDHATPVTVPPHEEAPSSTGLVIEANDEESDSSEE